MRSILAALVFLGLSTGSALGAAKVQELNHIVAVVNDDVITSSQLDQRTDQVIAQLRSKGTQLPPRNVLVRQVLDRLIVERLELKRANDMGIRIGDEEVNQVVAKIARENHFTLDQFRKVLERDGFQFADFRENIRHQMMISRLHSRIANERVKISDQEVKNFLANTQVAQMNTEYHLAHILVALPEAPSPAQVQAARDKAQRILGELRLGANFAKTAVSSSDGQQALQGGDLGWRKSGQLPTLFADVVGKMHKGDISDLIRSPSGFHILKLVDKRGESKHVVLQTHARHILIRTNEVTSDYDARTRLERLRQRILNGEDFAKLARANSDDKGSAANGGDLGWASPGQMVPEFEKVMNETPIGQISKPFKTQFGWHIVQPLERRKYDNTEEYKRSKARELLHKRKAEEELQRWVRQLRDEAYVEIRLNS